MGRFTFDDDEQEEPTFSFSDFMKWMVKQNKEAGPDDVVREEKAPETKDDFKQRFKDRIKRKKKGK